MKKSVFAGAVLVLLLACLWVVGIVVLHWKTARLSLISAVVVIVAVVTWLAVTWFFTRRARRLERGLTGTGGANPAAVADMRDQFGKYLDALKLSPNGKGALATLPWYVVIGAPGAGKTTMIQESGLAFSSLGSGLRAIRGIGGTRSCDWWFTDQAILLDTAGRYTNQPYDRDEWLSFLDLVRANRGRRALNGVIVLAAVPELIKQDDAGIAATVQPIRERLGEISRRLSLVLPVYVVFSKCDMIGGFKDFFAGLSRAERDQVWGCTFAREQVTGVDLREVFTREINRLTAGLQARRLAALTSPSADNLDKIQQFPGNFAATGKWLGTFVAELFRPSPTPDQPILRGAYFTSGTQPPKPGETPVMPTAAAPAPAAAQPDFARQSALSIFFSPSQMPRVDAAVGDSRKSLFVRDLFTGVIVPDHHLAGVPTRVLRRRRIVALGAVYGSALAALLVIGWLVVGYIGDSRLIGQAKEVGSRFVVTQRLEAKNTTAQLALLDRMREVLVAASERSSTCAEGVGQLLHPYYYPLLVRTFVAPAADALHAELEKAGKIDDKGEADYGELFDLFRAYQMLSGNARAERPTLERALLDKNRWFISAASDGKPSAELERQGRDHLAYLASAMDHTQGWSVTADRALVERITASLGDALLIQGSYAEAVAALQGSMGRIGRDELAGGEHRELLASDVAISGIFSQEGWESTVQAALDEKAVALAQKFSELKLSKSVSDIRRRLRALYAADYNRQWLKVMSSIRPARFTNLADALPKLRALTGPDSPYLEFARTLVRAQSADISSDARNPLPTDEKWLRDGLAIVTELIKSLERFQAQTATSPGAVDFKSLKELCDAADKTSAAFNDAVRGFDSNAARAAALQCLANLLEGVQLAAVADLGAERDKQWQTVVLKEFASATTKKFPFDPSAASNAENEVSVAAFTKLFNPKSGLIWQQVKVIEDLRQLKFASKELLPVSWDYQRFLVQCGTVRAALFNGDSDELTLKFDLRLDRREGVKTVTIAIGAQKFDLYDRPDGKYSFAWTAKDTPGAKLAILLPNDQWLTKDYPTALWSILRLLRDGTPTARTDGGLGLAWTYEAKSLNRNFVALGVLENKDVVALVPAEFFSGMVCPAKITR